MDSLAWAGALFRIPRRRTTFLAVVNWIPAHLRCDRRGWLALSLTGSLNSLLAALAFGLIVYGVGITAAVRSEAWFDRE